MKILIVEDELIIAEDLKFILEGIDHTVIGITQSGHKAIEIVERERPDTIFMDIRLKGNIDGIETAQIIYDKYKISVIFFTSIFKKHIPFRALSTNPYGFVIKPVLEHELKTILKITADQLTKRKVNTFFLSPEKFKKSIQTFTREI